MELPAEIEAKARDIVERIAKAHPWKAACVSDIARALMECDKAATERARAQDALIAINAYRRGANGDDIAAAIRSQP